jgi:hypothetical protein
MKLVFNIAWPVVPGIATSETIGVEELKNPLERN